MKPKSLLLCALVTGALLPAARAVDLDLDIHLGRAAPPPPPEIVVVDPVGPAEPPPWAHPRASAYNYYYYPEADVYYRADTHTWFYLEGRNWRTARQLPPGIRVDFGRSVALRLDTDRPYIYHERVVAYYPHTYFTRVRYRDHDNHWHEAPGHDRHDDHDHHDDRHDHDRH